MARTVAEIDTAIATVRARLDAGVTHVGYEGGRMVHWDLAELRKQLASLEAERMLALETQNGGTPVRARRIVVTAAKGL